MTTVQAWRAAARVHTLPAAVVPVAVGSGLAFGDGAFRWDAFALSLVVAVAVQVAANFANDVSDAQRGADHPGRVGPPRMVATGQITPRQMWVGVVVALGVAGAAGLALALIAGPVVIAIGIVSVVAMLGYVGGPWPYGYRGLGEVFVFVFFGLVATVGSRYVHDMTAPRAAWLLAIPVGLDAAAILVVNNFRDLDTDAASGKRTLAVILGREATRRFYALLIFGTFALIAGFAIAGWTPLPTLLALLALPYAVQPIRIMWQETGGPALIRALVMNSRSHLWTGLALALGSAIGGTV